MAAAKIQDGVSDDFDYEHWASIVETRLVENGVWDVVENRVSPDPTKIPEMDATSKVIDLAQWRNRVMKDNKALKIMQSSLPDSVFRKTISVASSKDLWDLLQKGNDSEEAKQRILEKQFEKLMMNERESMDRYVKRVLDITERFRVSGNPKSDDQVIAKLLSSPSRSYDDAIPVLEEFMTLPDLTLVDLLKAFELFGSHPETMPHELKKFIEILRKAWSERMWCGVCKKDNHNQEDCYYNSRVVNSSGAGQFRGQCGERGHYARDCNTRNLQPAATQQAQIDQKRIQKPDHRMLAVNFGGLTFDEDMWMIYTTTSNHMTPYVKFFTTLDRSYRARVGMADGRVIMAVGKGDVMCMTMEGKKRMIKNVLFVPGADINVLSVGQMTGSGCLVTMGGGNCTIQDRNGKVFGEAMWDERGYALRLQVIKENIW